MLVGYARVSTAEQNPDHQTDALARAGVARDDIHVDHASGAKASRSKLDLVLSYSAPGTSRWCRHTHHRCLVVEDGADASAQQLSRNFFSRMLGGKSSKSTYEGASGCCVWGRSPRAQGARHSIVQGRRSVSSGEPGGESDVPLEAARLQPVDHEVLALEATDPDRSEADRIDRLAGDRDLIGELRRRGFDGPEYERAAEELVRYGLSVVTAWIRTGTIFEKVARRARPVERPPDGALDDSEALSMAGEVVTVALAHFRDDVLVPGRWDPARGASLTTFFVGQCLLRFPNIYRQWVQQVPRTRAASFDEVNHERPSGQQVEDDVITSRAAETALACVRSDDARTALVLIGFGFTYPQIAQRLGKTEKAVERMIAYARTQVQRAQSERDTA